MRVAKRKLAEASASAIVLFVALSGTALHASELAVNAYCPFPVGSPRVMGMAGAFTGIGTGAESLIANPAAVVRPAGFTIGNSEWDYMLSYTSQDPGFQSDFGNVGPALLGSEGVNIVGFGVIARFNRATRCPLGYGMYLLSENYNFTDGTGGTASLNLLTTSLAFGRTYRDDRLFVSYALDVSSPSFNYLPPGEPSSISLAYQGAGGVPLSIGLLWVPEDKPFQLGARIRGPRAASLDGDPIPTINPFPTTVVWPGEFSLGFAWKWGGEAPKNHGEWCKRGLLDIDVRGVFPMSGTTGFERFRSASPLEIRDEWLLQPSFGLEWEIYSRIAWFWMGVYREPARYSDVGARTHVTSGFKVRLLKIKKLLVNLSVAGDTAERYDVWSTSLGVGLADW